MPHLSVGVMTDISPNDDDIRKKYRTRFVQLPPMDAVALTHLFGLAAMGIDLVRHSGLERPAAAILEIYTHTADEVLDDYTKFADAADVLLRKTILPFTPENLTKE